MSKTTFTGPIKAGDVLNTTGSTPGSVKNVGFVEMVQTVAITQAGTAVAGAVAICIPAYSHITNMQLLNTAAWDGVSPNISIGTSVSANELVSGVSAGAVGINSLTPGTNATRAGLWSNVGADDVIIYVLSTNTGNGVGDLVIRYIQAENVN